MADITTYRVIDERIIKNKLTWSTLVCVQKLYSGHIHNAPLNVAKFLNNSRFVDSQPNDNKAFLGVGCLAAQLVHVMKKSVGDVFIITESSIKTCGADYTFDIIANADDKTIMINAYENDATIFTGTPQEFINQYSKKEDDKG